MKNKLLGRRVFSPRLDLDSRRLWPKGIPELQAVYDFSVSSVMWPGYLNLDESFDNVPVSLNLGSIDEDLVEQLWDSFDWDATEAMSVFKGQGRHISNDLVNLDVFLKDETFCKVQDKKFFSKSYGGFKYNDLFFEYESLKRGRKERGSQIIFFKCLGFKGYVDFKVLAESLESFSDSELNTLIKKELKK